MKNFVCPFHGWVYGLDGALKGITRAHDFPGVKTCDYGLVELPAAESGGLIWVGRTPGETLDIPGFLGTFHEDLVNFDVASLVQYKKTKVVKEANWKLLIKTYLEATTSRICTGTPSPSPSRRGSSRTTRTGRTSGCPRRAPTSARRP